MALVKCKECGNEVSTKAKNCPKCGAAVPATASTAIGAAIVFFSAIAAVAYCSSPDGRNNANSVGDDATREAELAWFDASPDPVPSCGEEDVRRRGIEYLTIADEAAICRNLVERLSDNLQNRVFRTFLKATAIVASKTRGTAKDASYQLINVVEARGSSDPTKVINTLNVAVKVLNGTDGHITPRDLNIALRSAGSLATTMSDDGIYTMAAVMWEDKKSRGE